jgi:hypothetical protein
MGMSKPRLPERAYTYSKELPFSPASQSCLAIGLFRHVKAMVPPRYSLFWPVKNTRSPRRILLILETLTSRLPGATPHMGADPSGNSS